VLMSIGFTHHQASLILQVAEAQQQQQQHANAPAGGPRRQAVATAGG
jgi:hypothetical protein